MGCAPHVVLGRMIPNDLPPCRRCISKGAALESKRALLCSDKRPHDLRACCLGGCLAEKGTLKESRAPVSFGWPQRMQSTPPETERGGRLTFCGYKANAKKVSTVHIGGEYAPGIFSREDHGGPNEHEPRAQSGEFGRGKDSTTSHWR